MKLRILLSLALTAAVLTLGCGLNEDDPGLSPASDYRRAQLDRALEGVSVVDGRIVAEPAASIPAGDLPALMGEVDDLLRRGLRADAVERAVTGVRGAPADAGMMTTFGRTMLTTRRTAIALAAFDTAVSLDPSFADGHFLRGIALQRQGDRGEAMAAWHAVLELEPDHEAAQSGLPRRAGSRPIPAQRVITSTGSAISVETSPSISPR